MSRAMALYGTARRRCDGEMEVMMMRKTNNLIVLGFLVLFFGTFSACSNETPINSNPSVTLDSPVPVFPTPDTTPYTPPLDEAYGNYIIMYLGSKEAIATRGEDYALNSAPFEQDGTVYVPLADVMAVWGGTVTQKEDGVFSVCYEGDWNKTYVQVNMDILLGSNQAVNNITGQQIEIVNTSVYADTDPPAFPIFWEDTIFVPDYYMESIIEGGGIDRDFDAGQITVTNFRDGWMMAGFTLEDDFEALDEETKARFTKVGATKTLVKGDLFETAYSDGDVSLGVRTGNPIISLGQSSWLHSVTLLTDKYATPRGLKVGDTVERCNTLYLCSLDERGYIEAGIMKVTFADDVITSITLYRGS